MEFSKQFASVLGIGTDLVEIDRIRKLCERYKNQFYDLVFTKEECDYCLKQYKPYESFSARFAAKEAVAKAFSVGIGKDFYWKSASVENLSSGQPVVKLDFRGQELLKKMKGTKILISLSHTKNLAQAFVVII